MNNKISHTFLTHFLLAGLLALFITSCSNTTKPVNPNATSGAKELLDHSRVKSN